MRTVKVNICENNDFGNPSGKVHSFDFGVNECTFHFEARDFMKGVKFDCKPRPLPTFSFLSQEYVYFKRSEWYGSMAVNLYEMSVSEALRLLNVVAFSKEFSLTYSDDIKINDLIDNGIQIKASDMDWCDEADEIEPSIFNANQLGLFQN